MGFAIKEKVSLLSMTIKFVRYETKKYQNERNCSSVAESLLQVIPRAVLYFTGDIFGDDDEDFEDCEDEDSEEED